MEQSGIEDEVEIRTQNGNIILFPAKHPRHDWDEAFRSMHERGDDKMLDENLMNQTRWDDEE